MSSENNGSLYLRPVDSRETTKSFVSEVDLYKNLHIFLVKLDSAIILPIVPYSA